jgi:Transposase, Mutator family
VAENKLVTRIGKLELRMPRDRAGEFSTQLFERSGSHLINLHHDRLTLFSYLAEEPFAHISKHYLLRPIAK